MKFYYLSNKKIPLVIIILLLSVFYFYHIFISNRKNISIFDGKYYIKCFSDKQNIASASFFVINDKINGKVLNAYNHKFNIKGSITNKGIIIFDSITREKNNKKIVAFGKIDKQFFVKGKYSIDKRAGEFFGYNFSKVNKQEKGFYDGEYNLIFFSDLKKKFTCEIIIKFGVLTGYYKHKNNNNFLYYTITGRASETGQLLITIQTDKSSFSNEIVAVGTIENSTITGVYFENQKEQGKFEGRKIFSQEGRPIDK